MNSQHFSGGAMDVGIGMSTRALMGLVVRDPSAQIVLSNLVEDVGAWYEEATLPWWRRLLRFLACSHVPNVRDPRYHEMRCKCGAFRATEYLMRTKPGYWQEYV